MGLSFVCEEQPDLTLPQDSIHRAKLLEIKDRTINWNDRQTGEAKSKTILEWWFEITQSNLGDMYVGRRVKGESEAKFTNHPGNKFHNWAETLLGREIPAGMGIETDDLTGLPVDISIGHRPDKKDPEKVWEYVDELLPAGDFQVDEPPF